MSTDSMFLEIAHTCAGKKCSVCDATARAHTVENVMTKEEWTLRAQRWFNELPQGATFTLFDLSEGAGPIRGVDHKTELRMMLGFLRTLHGPGYIAEKPSAARQKGINVVWKKM